MGSTRSARRNCTGRLAKDSLPFPVSSRASISALVPFGNSSSPKNGAACWRASPAPDTKPATAAEGMTFSPDWNSVGADYFKTVGLPLVARSRLYRSGGHATGRASAVAIIDEVLAKKLWPDGEALGQHIQFPILEDSPPEEADASGKIRRGEPIEIVGIVPSTKKRLFERTGNGSLYIPFARGFQNDVFFFVRKSSFASGNELGQADQLRKTVQGVDPLIPILELRTFAKHMDANPQLWVVRAAAAMFSVFGILALGLAVVGIYGVKAYSVSRRTREIGIRMALGAEGRTVLWMFLREGLFMVTAGLVLGLLLAFGTGKIVSSILFEVSSTDPLSFTLAPAILAMAALLATWIPARRATRISPMAALRTE